MRNSFSRFSHSCRDRISTAVRIVFFIVCWVCFPGFLHAQTPSWIWAASAGGASNDVGQSIAVDGAGNSYVTGYFNSSSITFGSTTLTDSGSFDIFVAKYDANGNVVWAKSAGGSDYDGGFGIAVDGSGNSYVIGYFNSSSITFGSTTLTNSGVNDIFVVKYDANGNVVWAKSAGGSGNDAAWGIAVDGSGNSYVTGYFSSSSITFGSTTLTNSGSFDIFVVKYDANGNVVWAKSAGGSGYDGGCGVAVDGAGNSYVTGSFVSSSITFGSTTLTNSGGDDIFVVKYDANGNVVWAKSAGGSGYDDGYSIAVDGAGNSYVTGYFYSSSITFGSTTLTNSGVNDIFVVKYDANGNVVWAKSAGGSGNDAAWGIAVDGAGNSYVTGYFNSSTLTFGSTTLTNSGGNDIFVVKYDANGNAVWAKSAGGSGTDAAWGIAVDGAGNSYVTGCIHSPSITFGSTTLTNSGSNDIFVAQVTDPSPYVVTVKDVPNDQGGKVFVNWKASSLDLPYLSRISIYTIFRGVSPAALTGKSVVVSPEEFGRMEHSSSASVNYEQGRKTEDVYFKLPATPQSMQDIYWQDVGEVSAEYLSGYSYIASTPSDSGPQGNPSYYFMVRANVGQYIYYSNGFWNSNIDSGYSVDNLAPLAPRNFAASYGAGQVALHWVENTEPDLYGYVLYRGTSPAKLDSFAVTGDTSFVDAAPSGNKCYAVRARDIHGNLSLLSNTVVTGVSGEKPGVPTTFALEQNYPNPFNPQTVINYELPKAVYVRLVVYDMLGREVATVVNGAQDAGYKSVEFNAANLPSGIYTYRLTAGTFVDVKKMLMIK